MQIQRQKNSFEDESTEISPFGQAKFHEYAFNLHIQNCEDICNSAFVQSVDYFEVAFDQSFVVMLYGSKLQHYSPQGDLQNELYIQDPNPIQKHIKVYMPNLFTVIIICYSYSRSEQIKIIEWNIESYEKKQCSYPLKLPLGHGNEHCQHFFHKSNYLCLIEKSKIQLKLSYFNFNESFDPFHTAQLRLPKGIEQNQLETRKGDDQQTITIIQKSLSKTSRLPILLYSIKQKDEALRLFQIEPKVTLEQFCSIRITDFFRLQQNLFYLKIGIEPNPKQLNFLSFNQKILKQLEKQKDFIWDITKHKLQQLNFGIEKSHIVQFTDNYRQINLESYEKQYITAARKLKAEQISELFPVYGDKMEDYFKRELIIYQWEKSLPYFEQVSIFHIDRKSLTVKGKQKRSFPILKSYEFAGNNIRLTPIRGKLDFFLQFETINKTISIKIRKCRQLFVSLRVIYADIICSLLKQVEQDMVEQTIELLPQQQEQIWKWKKRESPQIEK